MGAESDQEIITLMADEPELTGLMVPTLQDCKASAVFTQAQALDYLGACMGAGGYGGSGFRFGRGWEVGAWRDPPGVTWWTSKCDMV